MAVANFTVVSKPILRFRLYFNNHTNPTHNNLLELHTTKKKTTITHSLSSRIDQNLLCDVIIEVNIVLFTKALLSRRLN